ncbi:hypothetical protein Lalb_Chr14g0363751 [Lupinus albus]|uniref:Uncharacterized protein n=1 Tax=Lupinus albus TaxID=3870 RepID=A0A6A4P483_LUPAL|nr:hypothetical protein Lalb_Chr14g0363751 [Lupinus albus]
MCCTLEFLRFWYSRIAFIRQDTFSGQRAFESCFSFSKFIVICLLISVVLRACLLVESMVLTKEKNRTQTHIHVNWFVKK